MTHLISDGIRQIQSVTSLSLLVVIFLASVTVRSYLRRRFLPPGPRCYPIVGNALQVPTSFPAIRFAEWAERYGPIFSLDLMGQTVVVLNRHQAALDLLDRRSTIYSDRPRLIMGGEILTRGLFMPFIKYGDVWRRHRRAAHASFNQKAVEVFQPIQVESAVEATLLLLDSPEHWEQHIERFSGSNILRAVYGWPALTSDTMPAIERIRELVTKLAATAIPGAYLVELFPWMKHLPNWLATWKRDGLEWCGKYTGMLEELESGVAARMSAGEEQQCFVSQLLKNEARLGLVKPETAWLAGTVFAGGAETTASSLEYFVLAMVLYPDVMSKAQAEIEAVVGRDRSPTFEDAADLPYIGAMVKELLRWRPTGQLGMPHSTTADDWYEGYFIPKGAMVMSNIWAMNRDPQLYPDYGEFRPERFLEATDNISAALSYTRDMGHVSYGFGRRICLGVHYANQALFIMMATLLWAVDIRPKLDEHGVPIKPSASKFVDKGVVIGPAPFECTISPRFKEARAILKSSSLATRED